MRPCGYPTMAGALAAQKIQLGRWYSCLPSPRNEQEAVVLNAIIERFQALGGWDPQTSKAVGWE
jgi:hypothetical protein